MNQYLYVKVLNQNNSIVYAVLRFLSYLKAEEVTEAKRFTTAKLTITVRPVDASPPVVGASSDEGVIEENSPKSANVVDSSGKPIQLTVSDPDLVTKLHLY